VWQALGGRLVSPRPPENTSRRHQGVADELRGLGKLYCLNYMQIFMLHHHSGHRVCAQKLSSIIIRFIFQINL
jgi:hypothetical protein